DAYDHVAQRESPLPLRFDERWELILQDDESQVAVWSVQRVSGPQIVLIGIRVLRLDLPVVPAVPGSRGNGFSTSEHVEGKPDQPGPTLPGTHVIRAVGTADAKELHKEEEVRVVPGVHVQWMCLHLHGYEEGKISARFKRFAVGSRRESFGK